MATRQQRAWDNHPRIECTEADGGGHHAEYRIKDRSDVMLQYDIQQGDPMFPWTPIPVSNGRMVSGFVSSYQTCRDALAAIDDGSWRD